MTRWGVTWARQARPTDVTIAEQLAGRLGCPVVPREQRAIETLCAAGLFDGLFVVGDGELSWRAPGGLVFAFHPNMAVNRIRPAAGGGARDLLVRALELQPGHRVLDATLGLGADAIVMAHRVGETGLVWGTEASPVIAEVVRWGLAHYEHWLDYAMRRVRVLSGSHREWFERPEVASIPWHGIVFDPMYEQSRPTSHGLDGLRQLACYDRLEAGTIEAARRLATGWVVVKGRPDDPWFEALRPDRKVAGRRRRVVFACFRGRRTGTELDSHTAGGYPV